MEDRSILKTRAALVQRLGQWKAVLEVELTQILQFWMTRMVDYEHGGFYGRIDGYGQLHPEAEKGIILNSRILWTFAAAARFNGRSEYALIARRAYEYIVQHFWDERQGGVFWMLDNLGNPVNTRKQVYAQAFAIYAFAQYYELTKDQACLERAAQLYSLLERHSLDVEKGGYFEAFARDWSPIADLRLSEKDANEAKTMNTHLHLLEAYANYYRVAPFPEMERSLRHLIRMFLDHFIDLATGHLRLFFDENWWLKSHTISFGHDIESSWLLYEAADVLGDEELMEEVTEASLQMAEATVRKGLDAAGALMNEAEPGGRLDTNRHWWPQAEAAVGFFNAYELTGKEQWIERALAVWAFIEQYLKDEVSAEWHWRVDADGRVCREEDLAGPWKAPYHNGRACMELIRRIEQVS
jgi:mannobiose 2-epimerase